MHQPLLNLAEAVVQDLFSRRREILHEENSFSFRAHMPVKNPSPDQYLEITINCDTDEGIFLLVGNVGTYAFNPSEGIGAYINQLDASVRPFVEQHYDVDGDLTLEPYGNGFLVPTYYGNIDYTVIENTELTHQLRLSITRCIKTLSLVQPIFAHMFDNFRRPNAHEQRRMLYCGYGAWEIQRASLEVPEDKIRLPAGLFGGIEFLGRQ